MADDEEFLRKLAEAFAIEAREHLDALSTGLLEIEKDPGEAERRQIVETIFREAHSLKGAARSVNRRGVETICQEMEGIFAAWKKSGGSTHRPTLDLLGRALELLDKLLNSGEAGGDRHDIASLLEELRNAAGAAGAPAPGAKPPPVAAAKQPPPPQAAVAPGSTLPMAESEAATIRISTAKMDSLLLRAEEMVAVKNAANHRAGELLDIGRTLGAWKREWGKAEPEVRRLRDPRGNPDADESMIRLADFLDWNLGYVNSLEERLAILGKAAETDRRVVGGMVDELLSEAKRLVMLPFSNLLDSLPRQVRDLARSEAKEVHLILRGREVEIDKRILEWMKEPLTHLIRNAVGHGIEKPETRAALGKPAEGTLSVAVSQRNAGQVEILVSDDGGGIDAAELRKAAVRGGVISAAEAAARTDEEALMLLFQSGVSTSPDVGEISGRGLGMAIVREKAERLGGSVTARSIPGRGTSFRIVLPVTIATFKGLLIRAGGQDFIVPFTNVERAVRFSREEIRSAENKETVEWKGKAISVARLDAILGLPSRDDGAGKYVQTVLLAAGETRIAFIIDSVADELEVLVKPLRKPLVRVRNIAAAAVPGSERVVLILHVPDLLQSAIAGSGGAPPIGRTSPRTVRRLLVVDDSVTSRMLLRNILDGAGFAVQTAVDGVEALTILKTNEFDLVVSDVQMPRMDGFDLTARIRADKRLAGLPVVLVTALEAREDKERGIEAGANAYIVKSSFDQSNLLEVIKRLI